MKVFVLKIWGSSIGVFSTLEKARKVGRRIKEPTSESNTHIYYEFGVEEWTVDSDTGKCEDKYHQFQYKTKRKRIKKGY